MYVLCVYIYLGARLDVCHFRAALLGVPTPKLNKQADTLPASSVSVNSLSVVFLAVGSVVCGERGFRWTNSPIAPHGILNYCQKNKLCYRSADDPLMTWIFIWLHLWLKHKEMQLHTKHNHKFHLKQKKTLQKHEAFLRELVLTYWWTGNISRSTKYNNTWGGCCS